MKLVRGLILLALTLVVPIVVYYGTLWAMHDFNPYFLKIDACLDAGGNWDYDTRQCVYPEAHEDGRANSNAPSRFTGRSLHSAYRNALGAPQHDAELARASVQGRSTRSLMKISLSLLFFTLLALFTDSADARLRVYVANAHWRKVSWESVLDGDFDLRENHRQSFTISVYTPGLLLDTIDAPHIDLQKILSDAQASKEVGPFFAEVDIYLVQDDQNCWYLIQYEYEIPSRSHLNRFQIGTLSRIIEGVDAFFLTDYSSDANTIALAEILQRLSQRKEVIDRRKRRDRDVPTSKGEQCGEGNGD